MDRFLFFLLKPRAREPPVREPRISPIVGRNSLDFNFFCVPVLASIFLLKIAILEEN